MTTMNFVNTGDQSVESVAIMYSKSEAKQILSEIKKNCCAISLMMILLKI